MTGGDGIEQKRIVVRGRVQGVGFRYYARAIASSLHLRGTVRNLPDGRAVEAVVQGEPSRVNAFVAAMERGPSGAVVKSVEAVAESVDSGLSGFSIVE